MSDDAFSGAALSKSGAVRGGIGGKNYVTPDKYASASEAQAKLSLPSTPQVRMTLVVPKGAFSAASRVESAFGQPGGGLERSNATITKAIMTEVFHLGP